MFTFTLPQSTDLTLLVVVVTVFVVVVGALVVLLAEPPHRIAPFRVKETMLGGEMLPSKVTWKPLMKVSPGA